MRASWPGRQPGPMLPPLISQQVGPTVCRAVQTFPLGCKISVRAQGGAAVESTAPSLLMMFRLPAMQLPAILIATTWVAMLHPTPQSLAVRVGGV